MRFTLQRVRSNRLGDRDPAEPNLNGQIRTLLRAVRNLVYEAARARCRRCFALSLALRLFARIVLLDFVAFFIRCSDLDGIGALSRMHSYRWPGPSRPRPRRLTEPTARLFAPHPRHRSRPLRSRTFAAITEHAEARDAPLYAPRIEDLGRGGCSTGTCE